AKDMIIIRNMNKIKTCPHPNLSKKEIDFSYDKNKLGLTDSNLGEHIKKLEDVGYVSVRKIFIKNKPKSYISVTKEGIDAYQLYVSQLEAILNLGNKKI